MELKCMAEVVNLSEISSGTSKADISNAGTRSWKGVTGVPLRSELPIGGVRVHAAS